MQRPRDGRGALVLEWGWGGGVESAKIGVWRGDQSRARPPRIHGEDVDLDLENRAHCRRLNLM